MCVCVCVCMCVCVIRVLFNMLFIVYSFGVPEGIICGWRERSLCGSILER